MLRFVVLFFAAVTLGRPATLDERLDHLLDTSPVLEGAALGLQVVQLSTGTVFTPATRIDSWCRPRIPSCSPARWPSCASVPTIA